MILAQIEFEIGHIDKEIGAIEYKANWVKARMKELPNQISPISNPKIYMYSSGRVELVWSITLEQENRAHLEYFCKQHEAKLRYITNSKQHIAFIKAMEEEQ